MLTGLILLSVFVLGLSASFAPCLFPVLPSFIAFLTKADTKRANGFLVGGVVTLGIMTVFISIGLLINALGDSFFSVLQSNYVLFRIYEGIFLIILGTLIAMRITLKSNSLSKLVNKIQNNLEKQENPWVMAYLIGLFFTILAAPCAIVTFFTFFIYVLANPGVANAVILNVIFSIGAGMPFFIMGVLIPSLKDAFLKNQKKIFAVLPIVSGILIILTGIFLIGDANGVFSI